jgi:hypothetical protein
MACYRSHHCRRHHRLIRHHVRCPLPLLRRRVHHLLLQMLHVLLQR